MVPSPTIGSHAGPPVRSACHVFHSTDSAGGPIQMTCGISRTTSSGVASAVHAPWVPSEPSDWPNRISSGRWSAGFSRQAATTASMVSLFWSTVVCGSMTKPIQLGTAEYCTATVVTSPSVTASSALIAFGSTQPVPVTPKMTRYSRLQASTRSSSSSASAVRACGVSPCSMPTYTRTGVWAGRPVMPVMSAGVIVLLT